MATLNKVILLGNLGKDPEVKHFEGGTVKASFPLATSESYKDKNGNKVEQTEWHNVVVWRKGAEYAEKYLKKGNTVFVEGSIRTRSWEDSANTKKYFTEILADTISFVSSNEKRADQAQTENQTQDLPPTPPDGDDLPF